MDVPPEFRQNQVSRTSHKLILRVFVGVVVFRSASWDYVRHSPYIIILLWAMSFDPCYCES